jgi:putative membrane protein
MRILLAALHLVALGIGLGAVWVRARALRGALDRFSLQRAFMADALWGAAALLWIGTGLWRLLAEMEKPVSYYMSNHVFFTKMGFLVVILILEIWPMFTLIRWRMIVGRGGSPEQGAARRIAVISYVQAVLVVAMVFTAVAMARGAG